MRRLLLIAMLPTVMAACAEQEKRPLDLSLTCQLTKCICAGKDKWYLEKTEAEEVLWRKNGDAYCPEGYELQLADE